MKLNEVLRRPSRGTSTSDFETEITFEAGGFLDDMEVTVEFEYEGPSHTDHPYGSTTAREYHGATSSILSITLNKPAKKYEGDTDKIVKEWPKGTDVEKLPGWKEVEKSIMSQLEKEVGKHVEQAAFDAEEDRAAQRHSDRYD